MPSVDTSKQPEGYLRCGICQCANSSESGDDIQTVETVHTWVPADFPESLPSEPYCWTCGEKWESRYIDEIPVEDLPLYVSHKWLYGINRSKFQDRFRKEFGTQEV